MLSLISCEALELVYKHAAGGNWRLLRYWLAAESLARGMIFDLAGQRDSETLQCSILEGVPCSCPTGKGHRTCSPMLKARHCCLNGHPRSDSSPVPATLIFVKNERAAANPHEVSVYGD